MIKTNAKLDTTPSGTLIGFLGELQKIELDLHQGSKEKKLIEIQETLMNIAKEGDCIDTCRKNFIEGFIFYALRFDSFYGQASEKTMSMRSLTFDHVTFVLDKLNSMKNETLIGVRRENELSLP